MRRRLGERLRSLHEDESGASMVFAAITFFTLAMVLTLVYQVGLISSYRLKIQNAADAAAYSGALVEANSLDAIGQINDGMAYLHYTALRYVVDLAVYKTLNEFQSHDQWVLTMSNRPIQRPPQALGASTQAATPANGEWGPGIENPGAYEWVMLGDGGSLGGGWEEDWERVEGHLDRLRDIEDWLGDLEAANEMIVTATPYLVKDAAARVAAANGARYVAVSEDLELAFAIAEDNDDAPDAGFQKQKRADERLHDAVAKRYARRTLAVDGEPKAFPEAWFDWARGGALSKDGAEEEAEEEAEEAAVPGGKKSYSQTRLCWNGYDWAHGQREHGSAPNGHWHARHIHQVLDTTFTPPQVLLTPVSPQARSVAALRGDGSHGGLVDGSRPPMEQPDTGRGGGGHRLDDAPLHLITEPQVTQPHAIVTCPTCWEEREASGRWTDVTKTVRDVQDQDGLELEIDADWPRPLQLRRQLLRSGVTVATWSPSPGLGGLFPGSADDHWGTVAVATAQVGYQTGSEVLLLSALDDDSATWRGRASGESRRLDFKEAGRPAPQNYQNFFYSVDEELGVRFGARLVPIAWRTDDLSWHPGIDPADRLSGILGETPDARRWMKTSETTPRPGAAGQAPAELGRLADYLRLDSEEALERALWH